MTKTEQLVWHNDGHRVLILIDGETVSVTLEYCPNMGKPDTDCWHSEVEGCVVRYFVGLHGLECNLGMAPAVSFQDISWAFRRGRDLDTSEVRIMPTADEEFSVWMEEQLEGLDPEGE